MRKFNLLFIAVMLMAFSGCGDEMLSSETGIDANKIQSVISLDIDAKRLAFAMLNSKEKQKVWSQHFEKVRKENALSEQQQQLISDLETLNREQFFSGTMSETEKKQVEDRWLEKANKIFTNEQVVSLAYTMNPKLGMPILNVEDPLPNCACNKTSIFTCGELAECKGNCVYSSVGCGMFWAFECNGKCVITPS